MKIWFWNQKSWVFGMNKKENAWEMIVCVRNGNKSQPFWQNKICSQTLLISLLGSSRRVNKYILFYIFQSIYCWMHLTNLMLLKIWDVNCNWELWLHFDLYVFFRITMRTIIVIMHKIKRRKTQIKRLIKGQKSWSF